MRQLFQDPKAGRIEVAELPAPALRPGTLLVRNARSVISPGTERATVATARSSYLTTARNRPDLVRRVLDTVKREGVLAAYRKVQAKLSEPQALGYSSAGTVLEVGPGCGDLFRAGDRVACAGMGYASHAEIVCVPVNLAARVPDAVSFDEAAFATLGAIALHGVRQGAPTLGERFAVIGCGILGLFTVQLLRAGGARVAAFDLAPDLVERARELGAEAGLAGPTDDQVAAAVAWTEGVGVDGAIVTAASPSDAPMVAAAGMCRDRGRVVAVGLVPFGLPREIAYQKELDLRIARSYGPGRYDPEFEEKGIDYPIGQVRWTETRNLEAFLQLVGEGRVRVAPLVTHRYRLEDAPAAYDVLMERAGPRPLGMVLDYPETATVSAPRPAAAAGAAAAAGPVSGAVGVGFVGAGGFARAVLLPILARSEGVALRRVATAHGLTALDAQRKFGFASAGTDPREVLDDPAVHLVCIATRHDLHASLVADALRAGKHVFVEKPLALTEDELRGVEEARAAAGGVLLVGFNRRFAPMAARVREALGPRGPKLLSCRVNAGALPPGHWLNDPQAGGGRMIGEGCHFVDLLSFLAGDPGIVSLDALSAGRARVSEDLAVQIGFADGSVAHLVYTAQGSPGLGKERVEAHAGGASAIIEDWAAGRILRGTRKEALSGAGKGHREEIAALLAAVRAGGPDPVAFRVAAEVTRATFAVHARLAGRQGS